MDRTLRKHRYMALEGILPYQVSLLLHNYNTHAASQGKRDDSSSTVKNTRKECVCNKEITKHSVQMKGISKSKCPKKTHGFSNSNVFTTVSAFGYASGWRGR